MGVRVCTCMCVHVFVCARVCVYVSACVHKYDYHLLIFIILLWQRLLTIIYQYLQFPDAGDEVCRLNCLRALLVVMRNVWPR